MKQKFIIGFCIFLSPFVFSQEKIDLEKYLQIVKTKNKSYLAAEAASLATRSKFNSAGLDLEPAITAQILKSTDESKPSQLGQKVELSQSSVGLAKKFKSGTSVSVTGEVSQFNVAGPNNPNLDKYSNGSMGLSIKQSLWKDFFGSQIRRTFQREQKSYELERQASELDMRKVLIQMEGDFWNFRVAQEDLKLKNENLKRAEKLEQWTQTRLSNGISDQADLMNAKALSALRQLQLQLAQDELKTQTTKIRQNLELEDGANFPKIEEDLSNQRSVIDKKKNQLNVFPIVISLSVLEAQTKKLIAEEKRESLKPDLTLFGNYSSTAFNREQSDTLNDLGKNKLPKTSVGLTFSMLLNTGSKDSFLMAAEKEALSADLKVIKQIENGKTEWQEFFRRYQVQRQNVLSLIQISKFQSARALAERNKFNKGRTVTATVITAETEAAESAVQLLKAQSGLRQLEASAILFESFEF